MQVNEVRGKRRRRILFITHHEDLFFGGANLSLLHLIKRLDRSFYEPTVVCPSWGVLAEEFQRLAVDVEVVPMPNVNISLRKNPWKIAELLAGYIPSIIQLMVIMRKRAISLVHVNTSTNIHGPVAAKLLGVPVIWHIREILFPEILWRIVVWSVLACSTKVICVSEAVKKDVLRLSRELDNRISVIYNGVDLARYELSMGREATLNKFGIQSDKIVIGTVGGLIAGKGIDVLLEAAVSVAEAVPDAVFLIVGDGPLESELRELAQELHLFDKVHFIGRQEDVAPLYHTMDILVSATRSEGFGKVLIEAMAARKPVVATRVGGIPEIVIDQKTGVLVPVDSPTDMAQAIIALLRDKKKMKRFGEAGRKRVEQMFTWEISVAKVQELYAEVLGVG